MKILTGSILASALLLAWANGAQAQSGNTGVATLNGAPATAGGTGLSPGTSVGSGLNPGAGLGIAPSPRTGSGAGTTGNMSNGIGAGPANNTMRANGTSLNASPNPRAPNVAGRAPAPN